MNEYKHKSLPRYAPLTAVFLLVAFAACGADYDLVLRGGNVIDGTGSPAFAADVGIKDGLIAEVGDLSSASADRVVDVSGWVVTPGFVDMMGGSSLPLLLDPSSAGSKLHQGITTILVGEGGSLAPQSDDTRGGFLRRVAERGYSWTTYAEYFDLLENAGIALNVVHNVGAAQVRRIVIGDEDREPTPEQMSEMKALVAQAMEDGAVGLSTALIYPPGSYATTAELIELASVAAEHGGVYFSHMRNESNRVIEAVEEAIAIGEGADIPVHIYHLKAAGQENWRLMAGAIATIQQARDRGLTVTADVYPYIRNGIGLGSFLRPRHYARGEDVFLETLSDANVRRTLRREVETTADWENWYRHVGGNWDNVLITRVGSDTDPGFVGLSIAGVARQRGVDVWEAFFDLVQTGSVGVVPQSMNEEQKHLAMQAAFIAFDNDAAPTNPAVVRSSHPRAFGAFPRILAKYVREESVISLEEAIRKLSSLPAGILQLDDRGRVQPGLMADLVVFDPERIQDRATFTEPLLYSEGMEYVVVNGKLVIDGGQVTDAKPGDVVRHGRDGETRR